MRNKNSRNISAPEGFDQAANVPNLVDFSHMLPKKVEMKFIMSHPQAPGVFKTILYSWECLMCALPEHDSQAGFPWVAITEQRISHLMRAYLEFLNTLKANTQKCFSGDIFA